MIGGFRTVEISDPRFEQEELRHVTVKSAALAQRADVTVFVPAEVTGRCHVPLVILLHGVYGSHWAWTRKAGVHRIARRLIDAGILPPCVVAMPSDGLWGDGSGYVPHPERNFERWIIEEVPVAAAYAAPGVNADAPQYIAGLSMGGYGALRLAGRFPQKFRAVAGMSSITHLAQLYDFVEERIDCPLLSDSEKSVATVWEQAATRGPLPALRFDCGRDDPLLSANRELHQRLLAARIAHDYDEPDGGHTWGYWTCQIETVLQFFAPYLADQRPTT